MDTQLRADTLKVSGYTSLGGAVIMLIGAALWGASGTDLWAALDSGDMAGYLVAAGAVKGQLIANLTFWITGTLILGVAGAAMARLCVRRQAVGQIALACIRTGVPLVVVSYIAMLSLLVQLAPDTSATAVAIANVIGWIGVRADDLATALMLGATPFFLALAGRAEWMPTWLARWGYLNGVVGLMTLIVLYIPPLRELSFTIIPLGVAWLITIGISLLRRSAAQKNEAGLV